MSSLCFYNLHEWFKRSFSPVYIIFTLKVLLSANVAMFQYSYMCFRMNNQIAHMNWNDTFLSISHLKSSFPGYNVSKNSNQLGFICVYVGQSGPRWAWLGFAWAHVDPFVLCGDHVGSIWPMRAHVFCLERSIDCQSVTCYLCEVHDANVVNNVKYSSSLSCQIAAASMKKCRARYGLDQQDLWCRPCR